jgi:hypothetical protein
MPNLQKSETTDLVVHRLFDLACTPPAAYTTSERDIYA